MNRWRDVLIGKNTSILEALKIIDLGSHQIALVVDGDNKLLGTVSDGDARRAILKGVSLNRPVQEIMFTEPTVANFQASRDEIMTIMKQKLIRQIPIVDDSGHVIGLDVWEDIIDTHGRDNVVVLMAGGLGSRLGELTKNCPKPLLQVGNKPVLETIIGNCKEFGFNRFYISVNYKANMVKEYFGDGSAWGVDIEYLEEDKRLGTAGALGLLPCAPDLPMLVMNADVLTKINFKRLIEFHAKHKALATMCVREYEFQVPFGVVQVDNHLLTAISEKPMQRFFVNAGIYILNPETLSRIPKDTFFDMPSLFETLIASNDVATVFPIHEYWLDIGRIDDLERANFEYKEFFK